jgi:hypothetical protein
MNLKVKAIKSVAGMLEDDTLKVGDAEMVAVADTEAELVPETDGLCDTVAEAVGDPADDGE